MKNRKFLSSPLFSLKAVMVSKCLTFFSSSWTSSISTLVHVYDNPSSSTWIIVAQNPKTALWERDPGSALECPFIAIMRENGVFYVFNVRSGKLTIKVVDWIRKELKYTNSRNVTVCYLDVQTLSRTCNLSAWYFLSTRLVKVLYH